jgi:hypothetical protein
LRRSLENKDRKRAKPNPMMRRLELGFGSALGCDSRFRGNARLRLGEEPLGEQGGRRS